MSDKTKGGPIRTRFSWAGWRLTPGRRYRQASSRPSSDLEASPFRSGRLIANVQTGMVSKAAVSERGRNSPAPTVLDCWHTGCQRDQVPVIPLDDQQRRALSFLHAVGHATDAHLASALDPMAAIFGSTGSVFSSVGMQLVNLGLASGSFSRGYRPTDRAGLMLDALNREDDRLQAASDSLREEPLTMVGKLDNPVFYAGLLREIAAMNGVLIVDPYLPTIEIPALGQIPSVTRVLTGSRPVRDEAPRAQSTEQRRIQLAINLGAVDGRLQLRTANDIHDRYALPASGRGLLIGGSLGGRKVTTVVELSESATAQNRAHCDDIWDRADIVERIGRDETRA